MPELPVTSFCARPCPTLGKVGQLLPLLHGQPPLLRPGQLCISPLKPGVGSPAQLLKTVLWRLTFTLRARVSLVRSSRAWASSWQASRL